MIKGHEFCLQTRQKYFIIDEDTRKENKRRLRMPQEQFVLDGEYGIDINLSLLGEC